MFELPHSRQRGKMLVVSFGWGCLGDAAKPVSARVPQTREPRLVKIPTVKSIAGSCLTVIANSEKEIYREIEEAAKKELNSKRDEW